MTAGGLRGRSLAFLRSGATMAAFRIPGYPMLWLSGSAAGFGFSVSLVAVGWVTLEVSGQPVRVYNTHLDATRPDLRLAQAQQVAEILAEDDIPTVLGGDLNAWPASAAVAAIGTELMDTWTAAGQGRSATSRGGRKIDYLFVRGLRPLVSQVAASGASDHHRLWADVRLSPPDTCA